METTNELTYEAVIQNFADAHHVLPVAEIEWARAHWDEVAPRFIADLERYVEGPDRDETFESAFFYIVHLFGEMREKTALPALLRYLKHPTWADKQLDDVITTTLPPVLINLFDGDPHPLMSLVEASEANEYVRTAALDALIYQAAQKKISHAVFHPYVVWLFDNLQPRTDHYVWSRLVDAVSLLGYLDLTERVEEVFEEGLIDPMNMSLEDFQTDMARTMLAPGDMRRFERHRLEPFGTTIETLSTWDSFRPKEPTKPISPILRSQASVVSSRRNVGRNDPCPCGSGQKYKKCCLKKAS